MQTVDDNGFIRLWPTTMLQRQIANSDAANQALTAYIMQAESSRDDMTVDYLSENLFSATDPVVDWLKACVNKSVSDYLKQHSISYDVDWQLQAWANINRNGDYHNLHNHPYCYLSGTYYVQVPQKYNTGVRSDLNPGAISFYDPRPQANMGAIKGDGQIDPEYRVQPVPGLMLLWPSFLHHLVHPNLSDELRISVSFNVMLNRKDSYLPV